MDPLIFRAILAILLTGFVLHRGYYTRKVEHQDETVLEKPKPERGTQIASLFAVPALLSTLVYLIFPNLLSWAALPLPNGLRWTGVAIALLGFALLQWSQLSLGKNWSDAPLFLEGQAMVTNGPYRWIRHPIYTAFLMILGSTLLISANWLIGGLWIGMTATDILSRVRSEEAMLLGHFGEPYNQYIRKTGRFIPRFLGEKKAWDQ